MVDSTSSCSAAASPRSKRLMDEAPARPTSSSSAAASSASRWPASCAGGRPTARSGARSGVGGRHRADRGQQRRDPRRDLLRARLAQGALCVAGARQMYEYREEHDPLPALRQADRGPRRGRARAPGRARTARARERRAGAATSRRARSPRSSRTPAAWRRSTRRRPASWTSGPWQRRWPTSSGGRRAGGHVVRGSRDRQRNGRIVLATPAVKCPASPCSVPARPGQPGRGRGRAPGSAHRALPRRLPLSRAPQARPGEGHDLSGPDPSLPFLGVHLTVTSTARCRSVRAPCSGPEASASSSGPAPGAWPGAGGAPGSPSSGTRPAGAFAAAAADYVPEIRAGLHERLRRRAPRRWPATAAWWTISCCPRPSARFHVRNAPSPAATRRRPWRA